MTRAILLALAASLFTATSSVCQRLAARAFENTSGFDLSILFRLARRPIWLAGVASMIAGFLLQVTALHFGSLALVQPILAIELVFVFAYMRIIGLRSVARRDLFAAIAMAGALALFLRSADPSPGQQHTSAVSWWLAGLAVLGFVLVAVSVGLGWGGHLESSRARRAASLGIATGAAWGFVAAVIKELSSHISQGPRAIFSNWSPYVLLVTGALAMLLATNALRAGSLAASQPGFTLADPIVATLLGIFLFHERIRLGPIELTGELIALGLLILGVVVLSHSPIIAHHREHTADRA